MKKELVKKLKEAGFGKDNQSLSELIKACANRNRFELHELTNYKTWMALVDKPPIQQEGKTPEEAVAKLWLILQLLK